MDKNKQQLIHPGLYIVSTPIGNMQDITFRALNIFKKSDFILCEDTRRSAKLLSYYKIKNKLLSYHKFNEKQVSEKISNIIEKNKIISLISDAGTPTISDPGMILVKKCIEKKIKIYPVPGPSAVTSAVSVSGFGDKYLFYGFLSKKEKELENVLSRLSNIDYCIIFFVPAVKINFYIKQFKKYFYDRKILIAKEMTKINEELIRMNVKSLDYLSESLKGELTVVLSEKDKEKKLEKIINESVKMDIKKMLIKYSHKDVVEFISKKENLPKKLVYDFCLKLKK
tara:strand:+ start:2878 stop:3726 length:849 start_codon:yes stop_codon:yes gene_type:complete